MAEADYDIKDMLDTCYDNDVIIKKRVDKKLKFDIDTILNPSIQNKENEEAEESKSLFKKKSVGNDPVSGGKINVSIYLYPLKQAIKAPQGLGRENPNGDPHLINPPDRLKMSMNPLALFDEFVSPEEREKLKKACCILCCCGVIIGIFPIILANVITKGITSI